jgi:hypothetical protein
MENDDLVFGHGVKNGIPEPTDVHGPDASHFSFFGRIRMIESCATAASMRSANVAPLGG